MLINPTGSADQKDKSIWILTNNRYFKQIYYLIVSGIDWFVFNVVSQQLSHMLQVENCIFTMS